MTVEDLIALLSKCPKDYHVAVQEWDEDGSTFFVPLTDVSLRHDEAEVHLL